MRQTQRHFPLWQIVALSSLGSAEPICRIKINIDLFLTKLLRISDTDGDWLRSSSPRAEETFRNHDDEGLIQDAIAVVPLGTFVPCPLHFAVDCP
jgi:hypothetical protein